MLAKGGLGACRGRRADPVSTWLGLDLVSNAAQEPRTPLPSTVACSFSLVLLLRARPPQPTEGTAVTLTCETWSPPQQAHVPLQFRFFRDDRAMQPGWSRSPELQVAAVWSEDSRSYWCEAQAAGSVIGRSRPIQVQVQSERPAGPGAGPGWGGAVGLGWAGPGWGGAGVGWGAWAGSPPPLLLRSSRGCLEAQAHPSCGLSERGRPSLFWLFPLERTGHSESAHCVSSLGCRAARP